MDHDLGDVRAFLQVVESGGISAAATRMSVSKSVLGSRISHLQQALGAKLLHRSQRGVVADAYVHQPQYRAHAFGQRDRPLRFSVNPIYCATIQ